MVNSHSDTQVEANCYNEGLRYGGKHYYSIDILNADNQAAISDPLFRDTTDYHLQPDSPCRQAGKDQQGVPYEKDLDRSSVPNPPLRGAYGS